MLYGDVPLFIFRPSSITNRDGIDQFTIFLEKLAGEKQQIDNLRIPLQVALLISPIFLLQDAQMHLSNFYVQRYKIVLVRMILLNIRFKMLEYGIIVFKSTWQPSSHCHY